MVTLFMERFQDGDKVRVRYLILTREEYELYKPDIGETVKLKARAENGQPEDVLEVTRWCRIGPVVGDSVVVKDKRYPLSTYVITK